MAQAVIIPISEAVSATANAVGAVATSDTQSATNISEALKTYVSGMIAIPSTAAEIAHDLEKSIVSRGGTVTDSVGSAIKTISVGMYTELQQHPDKIKYIADSYVSAVDGAVAAAIKNIHAVSDTAGAARSAIIENVAATAVLPLQIATAVAGNIKKTLFGGSDITDTTDISYAISVVLLIVLLIILIWILYREDVITHLRSKWSDGMSNRLSVSA